MLWLGPADTINDIHQVLEQFWMVADGCEAGLQIKCMLRFISNARVDYLSQNERDLILGSNSDTRLYPSRRCPWQGIALAAVANCSSILANIWFAYILNSTLEPVVIPINGASVNHSTSLSNPPHLYHHCRITREPGGVVRWGFCKARGVKVWWVGSSSIQLTAEISTYKQNNLKMEDKPAGKVTPSNPPVESPTKKAHNPIGIESQWSLGWNGGNKDIFNRPNNSKGFNSYHNQSSIILGEGKNNPWRNEEPVKNTTKKTNPVADKPVWNYDPKNAGKTTMVLGSDKPDYRKKDEVYKERTPTTLTSSRKK